MGWNAVDRDWETPDAGYGRCGGIVWRLTGALLKAKSARYRGEGKKSLSPTHPRWRYGSTPMLVTAVSRILSNSLDMQMRTAAVAQEYLLYVAYNPLDMQMRTAAVAQEYLLYVAYCYAKFSGRV